MDQQPAKHIEFITKELWLLKNLFMFRLMSVIVFYPFNVHDDEDANNDENIATPNTKSEASEKLGDKSHEHLNDLLRDLRMLCDYPRIKH